MQRVGAPAKALNMGWEIEFENACPELAQLQAHFEKFIRKTEYQSQRQDVAQHQLQHCRSLPAIDPAVHLDRDVLNPGIAPTDYVHDGGLSLDDLRQAAVALAHSELVGFEISEFQYSWALGRKAASAQPLIESLRPLLQKLKA